MPQVPIPDYPADATEAALPDANSGAALLLSRRPELVQWLLDQQRQLLQRFGSKARDDIQRSGAALNIALARMGHRHGSWGDDFHAYHNENHALELMEGRLARLIDVAGEQLDLHDRLALLLFSACHDLRQRETGDVDGPAGPNEAASIAETWRILRAAGFDPDRDRWIFRTLELAIAGSTFDAVPLTAASRANSAELVARGGPLAPHLADWLDSQEPDWRKDATSRRAQELAQIASDLDTANVSEPLLELAASSIRLCEEREMRAGRALADTASAAPCLHFLTDGQERFFFELHRFCSAAGREAFAAGKAANAPYMRALLDAMREAYRHGPTPEQRGIDVIRDFARLALQVSDD